MEVREIYMTLDMNKGILMFQPKDMDRFQAFTGYKIFKIRFRALDKSSRGIENFQVLKMEAMSFFIRAFHWFTAKPTFEFR